MDIPQFPKQTNSKSGQKAEKIEKRLPLPHLHFIEERPTYGTSRSDVFGPKIFFKSIRKTTTKDTVESVLSMFGELCYLRFPYSKAKKRNLGYGIAMFKDPGVTRHLLVSVKHVVIDGRQIEFQVYQENERKSNIEVKASHKAIKAYIRQSSLERFEINSIGKEPTVLKAGGSNQDTAFNIRWNLHSIKPNHSFYYNLAASPERNVREKGVGNLLFRVLKPSTS